MDRTIEKRWPAKRKAQWSFCILAVAAVGALLLGGNTLFQALAPVWLAAALAYVLFPIVHGLERYLPSALAILLVLFLLIALGVGFFLWLLPVALEQAKALVEGIPKLIADLQSWLEQGQKSIPALSILGDLQAMLPQLGEEFGGMLQGALKAMQGLPAGLVAAATVIVTTPFFAFYFLQDRRRLLNTLLYMVPSQFRPPLRSMGHGIQAVLGRFLRAQTVVAIVSGALTTIGYLIIGQEYAILLGLVMGVFCLIPFIGPVIGAIPAVVVSVFRSPQALLMTLIVILVGQFIVGTILAPRIIDDQVGLHPVYMLISLLLGGALFGLWGTLLGVPIMLCLRVIVKESMVWVLNSKHMIG